jgi:hypothetical protein
LVGICQDVVWLAALEGIGRWHVFAKQPSLSSFGEEAVVTLTQGNKEKQVTIYRYRNLCQEAML